MYAIQDLNNEKFKVPSILMNYRNHISKSFLFLKKSIIFYQVEEILYYKTVY